MRCPHLSGAVSAPLTAIWVYNPGSLPCQHPPVKKVLIYGSRGLQIQNSSSRFQVSRISIEATATNPKYLFPPSFIDTGPEDA